MVDLEEILRNQRSRDHVLVRVDDEGVEDGVNGTGSVERHGRVLRFGVLSFSDGATNRHNFKLTLALTKKLGCHATASRHLCCV